MELGGWGGREDVGGVEGGETHDQNILYEKNLEWVALPQSPPYTQPRPHTVAFLELCTACG